MSKRKVQKDRTKAPQRPLKVPPRKTTIGDLIKFGARNREQREKVARYRRDWHRFAQELAPRVSEKVARRYLKEAAFIAGIDAGRLWFCLHNRDLEEAIKALVSLRELVGEFVTGQRKLPVRATTAPQLKSRRPLAPAGVIAPPKDAKKKKPKPPRVFSGNTRKPGSHRGPY